MKKPSLKETMDRQLQDKERFIHAKDENTSSTDISRNTIGEKMSPCGSEELHIKKTSSYLPWTLWIKYKTYELSQAQQGRRTSLNGLIGELLEEFFTKQNISSG
jgi:hypothetical protein